MIPSGAKKFVFPIEILMCAIAISNSQIVNTGINLTGSTSILSKSVISNELDNEIEDVSLNRIRINAMLRILNRRKHTIETPNNPDETNAQRIKL